MNARRIVVAVGLVAVVGAGRRGRLAASERRRALHGLRRGRGAHRPERGDRAGDRGRVRRGRRRCPPTPSIARLADDDIQSQLAAKRQEIAVQEANIRRQEEQVRLLETTWKTQLDAQRAELRQAEAGATLAAQTLERERALVKTGASTAQLLDEARARPRPGEERRRPRPRYGGAAGRRGRADHGRAPSARGAAGAARARRRRGRRARGDGRQVRHPRARRRDHRPDEVPLAGGARAAGERRARRARSRRQVRAGLRPGRRPRGASTSATRSRSSSTARPAGASRARSPFSPTRRPSRPRRSRAGATAWARCIAPRCGSSPTSSASSPGPKGNVYLTGRRSDAAGDPGRLAAMSVAPPIGFACAGS